MKFYRAVAEGQNLYKPSTLRGANTMEHTGRGIYAFVVGGTAVSYFSDYYEYGDTEVIEETLTLAMLAEMFHTPEYMWREIEVDELDNIQFGEGQYANMRSDNWGDYTYLPEAYIEFSEY